MAWISRDWFGCHGFGLLINLFWFVLLIVNIEIGLVKGFKVKKGTVRLSKI